jgi:HAD superfamily hydrolase (TIGR01490 family)
MMTAVFDLDGTLYTGDITKGIASHHIRHRTKLFNLVAYYVIHMSMWRLMQMGFLPEQETRERFAADMGWTIAGWTEKRAAQAFYWVADNYVLPKLRPEVNSRLQYHKTSGHRLMLVSGTCSPLLSCIGSRLGISETVGTSLMMKNGKYTGRSISPTCQGLYKVQLLKEYVAKTTPIQWDASFAYADSKTDIPLLECFGHPVATYPDAELAAYATERNWEIID